jgi:hypothetical protein
LTPWLPEGTEAWNGRPVARTVAEAVPRGRASLTGVVRKVVAHRTRLVRRPVGAATRGAAFDAWLDDGTGTILVRWVGRDGVPGVRPGVALCVEGTVTDLHGKPAVLNPLYRFEAEAGQAGSSTS